MTNSKCYYFLYFLLLFLTYETHPLFNNVFLLFCPVKFRIIMFFFFFRHVILKDHSKIIIRNKKINYTADVTANSQIF